TLLDLLSTCRTSGPGPATHWRSQERANARTRERANALDRHPHDFGVGVDQLVAHLNGHREAEAGLLSVEHDLVDIDRVAFGERQRRCVSPRAELVEGADGVFQC